MSETKLIQLSLVRIDGHTQYRDLVDQNTVREYAERMRDEAEFPPVKCTFDGAHYWLWDGFHRYFATQDAGFRDIRVEFTHGTLEVAQDFALGANGRHGLPRNSATKRKQVEAALSMDRHAQKSDREIARLCDVSHGEVQMEGLVKAFADHITVDIWFHTHCIGLTQTPCHFGGHRRWFICPCCDKRMGFLYMRHGRFACRRCNRISYESQSGDAEDRLIWRYHSLQHKMGNLELQPPRSRGRISNNFLEVAWQYDAMLDEALSRIAMTDATRC